MAGQKFNGLNLRLPTVKDAQVMRAIVEYEAARRRLTRGQACYELVMEAVDTKSYPAEIRQRIDEIEAKRRARAIAEALGQPRRGHVA